MNVIKRLIPVMQLIAREQHIVSLIGAVFPRWNAKMSYASLLQNYLLFKELETILTILAQTSELWLKHYKRYKKSNLQNVGNWVILKQASFYLDRYWKGQALPRGITRYCNKSGKYVSASRSFALTEFNSLVVSSANTAVQYNIVPHS